LDDRTGNGFYRFERKHGFGRGNCEVPCTGYSRDMSGRAGAFREICRQGTARSTEFCIGTPFPENYLHRGNWTVKEERRKVRVSGRIRVESAVGARTLADREAFQMSGHGL